MGDLNHDKSEKRGTLENTVDQLSIQLEAVDMRLADLEKDAFTFKREVLSSATATTKTAAATATTASRPAALSLLEKESDVDHGSSTNGNNNGNDPNNTSTCTSTTPITKTPPLPAATSVPSAPSAPTSATSARPSSLPVVNVNVVVKTETIVRHFQSKALQLESTKDKLKLQQMDQRNKLQKIEMKLKQKDDVTTGTGSGGSNGENNGSGSGSDGSSFHYIDLHKLQTDNKSYTSELQTKTRELGKIKMSIEKSDAQLVTLVDVLNESEKKKMNTQKSLDLRCRHLGRLKEKIERHRANLESMNGKQKKRDELNRTIDDDIDSSPKVDVMDIVERQTKIYELKSLIKTWTRKVEIAQLAKKNEMMKKKKNKKNAVAATARSS